MKTAKDLNGAKDILKGYNNDVKITALITFDTFRWKWVKVTKNTLIAKLKKIVWYSVEIY